MQKSVFFFKKKKEATQCECPNSKETKHTDSYHFHIENRLLNTYIPVALFDDHKSFLRLICRLKFDYGNAEYAILSINY